MSDVKNLRVVKKLAHAKSRDLVSKKRNDLIYKLIIGFAAVIVFSIALYFTIDKIFFTSDEPGELKIESGKFELKLGEPATFYIEIPNGDGSLITVKSPDEKIYQSFDYSVNTASREIVFDSPGIHELEIAMRKKNGDVISSKKIWFYINETPVDLKWSEYTISSSKNKINIGEPLTLNIDIPENGNFKVRLVADDGSVSKEFTYSNQIIKETINFRRSGNRIISVSVQNLQNMEIITKSLNVEVLSGNMTDNSLGTGSVNKPYVTLERVGNSIIITNYNQIVNQLSSINWNDGTSGVSDAHRYEADKLPTSITIRFKNGRTQQLRLP